MLDLTPTELKLFKNAGRRPQSRWLIWLPAFSAGWGAS